jgi:exoribonuclease-2
MFCKRSVKLGEQIFVKVAHADPRQDVIQFQELSYSEAQPVAN